MGKINLKYIISVFVVQIVLFLASSNAAPKQDTEKVFDIPGVCKDRHYCSIKPEHYEHLEEKMRSVSPKFLHNVDLNEYGDYYEPENLAPVRVLSPSNDWHNCPYETKREQIYLYYHGKNNTEVDIIVQTETFKQYVETVKCLYSEKNTKSEVQCFEDLGLSNFNMKSYCVTGYTRRILYVFDVGNTKIIRKYFSFPAFCSCRIFHKI